MVTFITYFQEDTFSLTVRNSIKEINPFCFRTSKISNLTFLFHQNFLRSQSYSLTFLSQQRKGLNHFTIVSRGR